MNQQFTTLKKAVEVFHSYGISLSGPRKMIISSKT